MRIITLEEHISFPEMASQIPQEALSNFGKSPRMQQLLPLLEDITETRLDPWTETASPCRSSL